MTDNSSQSPDWWVSGRKGTLSPWSQALVFGMLKVAKKWELHMADTDIAKEVVKVGYREGDPEGHPSNDAIRQLREKFANDPHWYPGKKNEDAGTPGRKKVVTAAQENAIAKCAMTLQKKGLVASVPEVRARCEVATTNPETGQPYTDKVILAVFRTRCFDPGAEEPWEHSNLVQKTSLSPAMREARVLWAIKVLEMKHQSRWFFNHCLWMDPCSSVLPGSLKTLYDQQRTGFGKAKKWGSPDVKFKSENMRASPYAGKQAQWGDKRVWWYIVMTRGKVHIEVMPDGWSQNGEGQAYMVRQLPRILKKMCGRGEATPTVVCTDRGPGYYHPALGTITPEYHAALEEQGLTAFAGEHAKWQPADIPDVLLHETAVAWVRRYLKYNPMLYTADLKKDQARLEQSLQDAVSHINTYFEVADLCHGWPKRLKDLRDNEGDRLKH